MSRASGVAGVLVGLGWGGVGLREWGLCCIVQGLSYYFG